jgi:hypothetical protein
LAVPLEDIAAAVANPETVGCKRSAAAKEMAPVHSAGAVAEPSGGGSARSEILQIDGLRDRGREAEKEDRGYDYLHHWSHPSLWLRSVSDLWEALSDVAAFRLAEDGRKKDARSSAQ